MFYCFLLFLLYFAVFARINFRESRFYKISRALTFAIFFDSQKFMFAKVSARETFCSRKFLDLRYAEYENCGVKDYAGGFHLNKYILCKRRRRSLKSPIFWSLRRPTPVPLFCALLRRYAGKKARLRPIYWGKQHGFHTGKLLGVGQ